MLQFPEASRAAALEALRGFLPKAGSHYARLRNFDRGSGNHSDVSNLSPWIRHRLVTEAEVVRAVKSAHGMRAAEKFIQEVMWRTYWKGWLEQHPGAWSGYAKTRDSLVAEIGVASPLKDSLHKALDGFTGIECFDYWSRELKETGYLHNHARMWFASIWIFTLKLPWELGADFFLRNLFDGDPASNTLSWRWVAGLQTKGKTYLARPKNINRYTDERFASPNQLSNHTVPIQSASEDAACALNFEEAIEPQSDAGLLIHEEDLSPEFLHTEGWNFASAIAVQTTASRSPLGTNPNLQTFVRDGLNDALSRSKAAHIHREIPSSDFAHRIVDWARNHNLSVVVSPYTPMGPTADALEKVWPQLSQAGIRVNKIARQWDVETWPLCGPGFFKFWNRAITRLPIE